METAVIPGWAVRSLFTRVTAMVVTLTGSLKDMVLVATAELLRGENKDVMLKGDFLILIIVSCESKYFFSVIIVIVGIKNCFYSCLYVVEIFAGIKNCFRLLSVLK